MKIKLIVILAIILVPGLLLITSCAQQNQPTITGTTGQTEQPQTGRNQGNQVQVENQSQTQPNETSVSSAQQNQTSQGSGEQTLIPSVQAKIYDVTIQGFAFKPFALKINKGDTVLWTNKDSAPHTITSDTGNELASDTLSTDQAYSHTFNQTGIFNYHCGLHQSMKARVEVT
ncbi:MAG TPA: cupredoxin family copper-binding protein [Candidatus Nanoarchaeia archaeon]|nr:cupredoxin family copper-binding protein [Candidatus Nanoarchaeia archaeon]